MKCKTDKYFKGFTVPFILCVILTTKDMPRGHVFSWKAFNERKKQGYNCH